MRFFLRNKGVFGVLESFFCGPGEWVARRASSMSALACYRQLPQLLQNPSGF
jgi:hypothetical protein